MAQDLSTPAPRLCAVPKFTWPDGSPNLEACLANSRLPLPPLLCAVPKFTQPDGGPDLEACRQAYEKERPLFHDRLAAMTDCESGVCRHEGNLASSFPFIVLGYAHACILECSGHTQLLHRG